MRQKKIETPSIGGGGKEECIFHKCIDSRFKKYSSLSSLLIRGIPGSGKTLIALSLASHHQGDFFYVSTRVSPEDIFETYPWFREEIKKLRVLDASRELNVVDATKRIFERAEDDVSSIIFSMKYDDKPTFLRALLTLLRDADNPLVVIDSLEAVQECIGREILGDLLRASSELGFRLVLVAERSEMGKEDYLVDGVVELRREIVDEAVLRKIVVHKLRGGNIPQPEYLFTLKDGRFRLFEPFEYEMPEEPKLFEPLEDPDENHFSSGSRSLDEIFGGGFPKGSTILFEVREGVTRRMYHRFVQTFKFNFLRNGRKIFLIPALGADRERILSETRPFVTEDELKNLIFVEREWGKERLRGEEAVEVAEEVYRKHAEAHRRFGVEDGSGLAVIGTDSIHSRYGEVSSAVIERGVMFTSETKSLALLILKPGFPLLEELVNLSDIHIKMENVCNVPVIKGLKPKTQYYAMIVDLSEGYPRVEFEKIE